MIIHTEIKQKLQVELLEAKSIWNATAMISYNGWKFIQENLSNNSEQHFLIGIDLATEPKVFEELLNNLHINARCVKSPDFEPQHKTHRSFLIIIVFPKFTRIAGIDDRMISQLNIQKPFS